MYLNIKEIRKSKKIKQETLATETGISVRSLITYEKDASNISLKDMKSIADALKVTILDLLSDEMKNIALSQLREPGSDYFTANDPLTNETQRELIEVLKIDIAELRRDKEFLRNLIESKFLTSNQ